MKTIKILTVIIIFSFFFILQIINTNTIVKEKPLDRFERHLESGMNDKDPILDKQLRHITPTEGFVFLSGNSGSIHNHPVIYFGNEMLYVIGFEFYKVFPIEKLNEAFEAYRELLIIDGILKNQ